MIIFLLIKLFFVLINDSPRSVGLEMKLLKWNPKKKYELFLKKRTFKSLKSSKFFRYDFKTIKKVKRQITWPNERTNLSLYSEQF